jgi:hypothetical protein
LGGLEATHGARKAIFVIVLDGCSFLHLNWSEFPSCPL